MIFWPRTFQDFHQTWGEKKRGKDISKNQNPPEMPKRPQADGFIEQKNIKFADTQTVYNCLNLFKGVKSFIATATR